MFICEKCHTQISSNNPSFQLVTKTRKKRYPYRPDVNRFFDDKGKEQFSDDPGGLGVEIAKEIKVCKSCFDFCSTERELIVD